MTAMRLKRYPSPSGGFALGKMGVGATMLKQGKTARDYVQSGLVAMWDGIENAGWGVHDASATTWKNLIGTGDFPTTNSQLLWAGDALVRDGSGGGISCTPNIDLTDALSPRTFEFVISALDLPQTTSTMYYFWALDNAGVRCTYSETNPVLRISLRASGGMINMGTYGPDIPRTTYSMVGTDVLSSAGRNRAEYFKNGTLIATGSFGGNATTRPVINLFRYVRDWPSPNQIQMMNFRIYSRALTANEIAANYAIDKERFNLP
jgi:hypothetical protein